ncbi:glutaredoxin domain-containing protein [Acaryochloris sp. CCMEE 5410]|uniref:glutaredoxin domain-containing protein n=1 Tax=Acaryochloris sp. CCMEE 5410 TaxID=310037 RepID=UPI0002484A94|nr:glutaredoxin domain-containing protein [Acaryochloris sp. CCMEE 5410]KAI9129113.1 glutaredoxin [Acaryochloris sp. CCMEE 5410]
MTTTLSIFTQPGCPYCDRAKAILDGIPNRQDYDVTTSSRNMSAAVYFSGALTVPQIFLGDYHIGGAEDLEQLQETQRFSKLMQTTQSRELGFDSLSDTELAEGAMDQPLRAYIPQSDGSRDTDPEALPILRFYKAFFGFWPNTFAYLHHWPEAYKLFVYCHNFSAVGYGKEGLGPLNMFSVGYSTSNAHGCSYCQVHSAATGGAQSLSIIQQLKQAQAGEADEGNPFGELELAIANLAADATRNQVQPETLQNIQGLSPDPQRGQQYITGVEMMVSAFGFLNVFNDLMGLEIEGEWAQQAQDQAGIETGRHAVQGSNPSNLDYEIPTEGPSIEEMLVKYNSVIANLEDYTQREFGLFPAWIQQWPEPLRKHHATLYGELMGNRDHTLIDAELKHLMARVSAIAKDHAYLAAVESYMAHHVAVDKDRAVERIRRCFAVATSRGNERGLFNSQEKAALKLAWLSAQMPLMTPKRFVEPVLSHYKPKALVQLAVACSVVSMVQRFVAISQPNIEPEVLHFLDANNLEGDVLALRYPLPFAAEVTASAT